MIAKRAWWTRLGCSLATLGALALSSLGAIAVSSGSRRIRGAGRGRHRAAPKLRTTEFFTIHGRACVLALSREFRLDQAFRAFVPALSSAIEEAAEKITSDTSAYLRAEMREHYRLRGDGVLSPETCAECTGRILAQFDVQLLARRVARAPNPLELRTREPG